MKRDKMRTKIIIAILVILIIPIVLADNQQLYH